MEMELGVLVGGVLLSLLTLFVFHLLAKTTSPPDKLLPPGKTGLPVIGETVEFIRNLRKGHVEKFVFDRVVRYSSPDIFKTSILGEAAVAMVCGPAGNRFLFGSGSKLVKPWRPGTLKRLFPVEGIHSEKAISSITAFVKPDGLRNFVEIMDSSARRHLDNEWLRQVTVDTSVKRYAFALACRLLVSIEDPDVVERMLLPMEELISGILSLPINLPGTRLNRALKASDELKSQLLPIIKKQRTLSMHQSSSSSSYSSDYCKSLLSFFVESQSKDMDVANSLLAMLLASHITTHMILTLTFMVLEDYPDVYRTLYHENMDVVAKKADGELLTWEDIQKLQYTWNVVREVMRLYSPATGIYREAVADLTYAGYNIPKGFKLYTSPLATHKDPKYFPDPEKFDPTRFEGNGPLPNTYLPFGGGPHMCPGRNFAKLEMIVFIHNVVKRFRCERLHPDEKIVVNPFPRPAHGYPVLLHPHHI